MPTTNTRKHIIPLESEASFNRDTIFNDFGNSIHDVVPVAGTSARASLVSAMSPVVSATNPLVVARADAPGLHRIEASFDGTVWLPASGILRFTTEAAANSWALSNNAYLTAGDRCFAGGSEYVWQGGSTWKLARLSGTNRGSGGSITANTMTNVAVIDLPANSPAGPYMIHVHSITGATAAGVHYQEVTVAGAAITDTSSDFLNAQPANIDIYRGDTLRYAHGGGAAQVLLRVQVNAANPYVRAARLSLDFVG